MKHLIILFLFSTISVYSQVIELRGKILNDADRSPLSFASVMIESKQIGSYTNESGFFSLKGNIDNEDFILISYIEFESKRIKVADFLNLTTKEILLENKIITSQTILVRGSIGREGSTPISFSKLDQSEIKKTYSVQDIPEVLSYQPSVTFYSENGNGIGYNYLSIRGFDQRRISVAINGIPQNDPEDHNVYWIDFPDLLESTELIQIQRGAGSGMIGYPAVGGSINIITSTFSDKPKIELATSYGSFNSRKYSIEYSSGLFSNKYSVYAKLSQILSSGYRNSSWTNLKSYHLSAVRYDENLTTQLNLYGGPIEDGLAYTGLPKFAIKDKDLRIANYSDWGTDNNDYSYTVERRPVEIENFSQPHFELLNELQLSKNISVNSALFLVLGDGFFDYDGSWADTNYFRLTREFGFNVSQNPSNALIRAQVDNKQWGWIPRVSIKHTNGELILGGELRIHRSVHWGSIKSADNLPSGFDNNYRYYYFEGGKDIYSFYAHENFEINEQFRLLAEAQLAYHKYKLFNERFVHNDFDIKNLFINPRIGLNYKYLPELSFYFSLARVSREPRLNNYYDAAESSGGATPQFEMNNNGVYDFSKPLVNPETMNDLEVGAMFLKDNITASVNFYYMLFKDEIVQQGQVDRFGQPITGNMEQTIHYGFEATTNLKISQNFEIIFNGAVSKNYISKGNTFVSYTDPNSSNSKIAQINLVGNAVSNFPKLTLNGVLKFNYDNFFTQLSGKYVGSFFTDNYGDKLGNYLQLYPGITDYTDNVVDSYFVMNFFASYNLSLQPFAKGLQLFIQVNNLFDNLYAAYGIGKEFFPAAVRNYLFGIKLEIK